MEDLSLRENLNNMYLLSAERFRVARPYKKNVLVGVTSSQGYTRP